MNGGLRVWAPGALLTIAAILIVGIDAQRSMTLRESLAVTVPGELLGFAGSDVEIPANEVRVAGMSQYLARNYHPTAAGDAGPGWVQIYVGYYESQTQGRTIHSPKNCLPGSGWQPLASRVVRLDTPAGAVPVNRYLLRRKDEAAVVLYWYQGRGRVEANEYRVKWNLLRDAALRHRTEEALVRIVVPVTGSEEEAFALAARMATTLVPAVGRALPT